MLAKKCLFVGILTLLGLSLAIATPPAVLPFTVERLVIDCHSVTPDAIAGDLGEWELAERPLPLEPYSRDNPDQLLKQRTDQGKALLREGRELLGNIAGARVPMPLGTAKYIEKCRQYEAPDF